MTRRAPKRLPDDWELLPSEELVRLVVDGEVAMWKPICGELARRPPSEEATRRLLDSALPPWLLSPILAASPHPIGYEGLRRLARGRQNDASHANAAVRGMAKADPSAAYEELSEWVTGPSKDLRGVAAVGLAALGSDAAARRIAEAAAAGFVSPLLAGRELGWMAAEALDVVGELLASDDELRWRTGAEAALARWRALPDDELVRRWRAQVAASLPMRRPRGLLGRWLDDWMAEARSSSTRRRSGVLARTSSREERLVGCGSPRHAMTYSHDSREPLSRVRTATSRRGFGARITFPHHARSVVVPHDIGNEARRIEATAVQLVLRVRGRRAFPSRAPRRPRRRRGGTRPRHRTHRGWART